MIDNTIENPRPSPKGSQFWQDKILQHYNKLVITAGALLIIIAFATGGFHLLNSGLANVVFKVHERLASGDVAIVAFGQESRAALGGQTATREQHAQLIRNLADAGAARIGMNFSFHETLNEEVDSKLIEAAKHATGRLVLSATSEQAIGDHDDVAFQEPFPALSAVAELGGIHLHLDDHGHVHEHQLVHTWRDGVIQSFASKVVESKITDPQHFSLDFSINPGSIPKYSYIDILNQQVPASEIKGKYIFVGPTEGFAGDTTLVPVHGTLSKIELHALAGEALVQGRLITELSPIGNLLIALFVFFGFTRVFLMFRGKFNTVIAVTTMAALIGIFVISLCYSTWQLPFGSAVLSLMLALAVSSYIRLNKNSRDLFKQAFEARERDELMRSIITTNFDGVVVFNERDRVYFINPTAAKMLNWSIEGALGREREALLSLPDDFTQSDGNTQIAETVITRADGNQLDVELAITQSVLTPLETRHERRKRGRTYHIYTFRDISVRKKAEKSMAEAAEPAVEADQLKSEFISNMSHELRAPLNSIIGFSEVIKQELYGNIGNPQYKGYAEDIYASGMHLMSIIDDLIKVSQIASGKVVLNNTEIDMERMFAECLQVVRAYPDASKKIISATIRPGCPNLIADPRALKQILINLLSNAIKFTRDGDGVRLSAAPSIDGGVEIMVSDDGIGIPPEEMDRITEAFHQIDRPAHRKSAGTGLGLHIVQSLAELHGAKVSVTSTVNSGTQVRVIFPPERTEMPSNVIPLEIEKHSS